MSERVFVLYKLRDEVTRAEYAKWLKEEHYPWGRSLPSQELLEGFFVTGDFDETVKVLQWDNIAIIDINSREQWYADQQTELARYHWDKWSSYVKEWKVFFTERIDA